MTHHCRSGASVGRNASFFGFERYFSWLSTNLKFNGNWIACYSVRRCLGSQVFRLLEANPVPSLRNGLGLVFVSVRPTNPGSTASPLTDSSTWEPLVN
ncbi:MAG: hypothetical protein HC784_16260 [Hydrococcus sp. CSU_1_8]|nr:hypothetical protein [Hydrococcus sp. CSU_1_8]